MKLLRDIERWEARPFHPALIFFVVLVVGIGRTLEEVYFGHRSHNLNAVSHFSAFYLATFFGFTAVATILIRQDWEKTARLVVFGVLAGLAPPLIDVFWLGPGAFRYSYLDGFYPTLHGSGNPYSEAVTAWSALAVFAAYLYFKSRSLWRALLGLGLAYLYLTAIVTMSPALLKVALSPIKSGTVRVLFYLLLSYGIYVALNFRRFKPSLKRIHHSLPWAVLVFLGAALVGTIEKMTWLQAAVVLLVHQGVVFANDYYDREEDGLNQRAGGVDRNDAFVMHALILWMAVHVSLVNVNLGLLFFLYLLFTAAYHHPLFRWKRVFPLNYALEGLVAALALLIGMTSAGRTDFAGPELAYAALAFAGFAAASPFKDYKDIPGDRATDAKTLYVLLEKRGWSLAKTHGLVTSVLLCFSAAPLIFLFLKGAPAPLVLALLAAFVVPLFFSLRSREKAAAVRRAVWLLIGYLAALTLALHFAVAPPIKPPAKSPMKSQDPAEKVLKDYGNLHSGAEVYTSAHPSSLEEMAEIVRKANRDRTRIRVRGNAHSMNGASLPRTGERLIHTDRLRSYRFEEPGSVTVGAGVRIYELRSFLKDRGHDLPVFNDGDGGPTVGGYIAAGGIGRGSAEHGGFWENVLEITLVSGAGEVLHLKPGDEWFPWMFGSMGQLGVIVSARLKILPGVGVSYPLEETGTIVAQDVRVRRDGGRLYWFTLFVPTEELETAKASLQKIQDAHPDVLQYRRAYVYPMKFFRFNPKLLFPADRDFVGVGIWGRPTGADPSSVMALERDIMELVRTHRNKLYRRYIQSEPVAPNTDYKAYFGEALYEEFLGLKRKLDPNSLLNCGLFSACKAEN